MLGLAPITATGITRHFTKKIITEYVVQFEDSEEYSLIEESRLMNQSTKTNQIRSDICLLRQLKAQLNNNSITEAHTKKQIQTLTKFNEM